MRITPTLAAMLVIAGLFTGAAARPALAETDLRTITVNGNGEISVPPDMATIRLGVRSEAETTGEALDLASAATADILAMLSDAGLEESAVQTGTIRLAPVYGSSMLSGARQITGYTATNMVMAELRELEDLGVILQKAVGEGANRLEGVSFGLQDPTEHEDAARRLAVADAARRAALYAEAGAVSLGPLVSLTEAGARGYAPVMADAQMERGISAASYEVPIAAGEITLSASIVAIYQIE